MQRLKCVYLVNAHINGHLIAHVVNKCNCTMYILYVLFLKGIEFEREISLFCFVVYLL